MSWATDAELDQLLAQWRGELRGATGPLRDHLATAVLEAVANGDLAVGTRLPAERRLAESLGISRGTVVAALDQLVARGILERRPGSGSYVRSAPVTAAPLATPVDQVLVDFWMNHHSPIDLGISSPIDPPTLLFAGLQATGTDLLGPNGHHGYSAYGEPEMRRVAAERLTHCGIESREDEVVVTCGAQQALQLAVRSLVKPGDRVFVDSPTYPGLLAILRQTGAVPVPLRTDAEGIVPTDLARAIDEHGPSMLATCSLVSNPEASVLSPRRREALLEIITRHDVVVLEDLTLAETLLDDVPVGAPLTADARVRGIAVGSASKLLWGGLRVGWLRTTETWLRRIAQAKALEDFGTSPVTQRIAAGLDAQARRAAGVARTPPRRATQQARPHGRAAPRAPADVGCPGTGRRAVALGTCAVSGHHGLRRRRRPLRRPHHARRAVRRRRCVQRPSADLLRSRP